MRVGLWDTALKFLSPGPRNDVTDHLAVDDGSIDTSVPKRPGIVNFYFVHNVKLNGEFCQHAFAVVWWYKADHDQGYFGKPAQVSKPFDYLETLWTCSVYA